MKKLIYLFSLLMISCSSDSDDGMSPTPDPDPTPTTVTYAGTVKAIIDGNCLNCHGNPTANGAPMFLTTLAEVQQAVTSRGLIGRIENGTMPPTGNLSPTQIQAIKDWQTDGFK